MSIPIHHRGDKPCYSCKHHEYRWTGPRYDQCTHPEAFVTGCHGERTDASSGITCGREGRRFEMLTDKEWTKKNKKWWEFWK